MSSFYPPEYTEKSRRVLDQVNQLVPDAVVIGGWGTRLRTGGPMSHDIDLIVTHTELSTVASHIDDFGDSRVLGGRTWRGNLDGVHLDLYVPHESQLGTILALQPHRLIEHRDHIDHWNVLSLEAHLATKVAALLDRPETLPGEKDRFELRALLRLGGEPASFLSVVEAASRHPRDMVHGLVGQAFGYLQDLDLDRQERRELRELIRRWQPNLGIDREPPSIGR